MEDIKGFDQFVQKIKRLPKIVKPTRKMWDKELSFIHSKEYLRRHGREKKNKDFFNWRIKCLLHARYQDFANQILNSLQDQFYIDSIDLKRNLKETRPEIYFRIPSLINERKRTSNKVKKQYLKSKIQLYEMAIKYIDEKEMLFSYMMTLKDLNYTDEEYYEKRKYPTLNQTKKFKEELIARAWHPSRLEWVMDCEEREDIEDNFS